MTDKDDDVRFNVKMRKQLRDDAKRNTERGELSEEVWVARLKTQSWNRNRPN